MKAHLEIGGEFDFVTKDEMDSGLDGLFDRISKIPRPTFTTRAQAGQMPASGPLILDLGKPPVGRVWNVLSITTYSADDATTLANAKVALYVGNSGHLSLVDLVIPGLTVPSYTAPGKGIIWVDDNANVIANTTGAAAASQVGVNISLAEWREEEIAQHTGR